MTGRTPRLVSQLSRSRRDGAVPTGNAVAPASENYGALATMVAILDRIQRGSHCGEILAARNFDALLIAARGAFTELATDVSLEEIARRAGVGIGTLYRNFATREDLIECVYVAEFDALCRFGDGLTEPDSSAALVGWLRRFVTYVGTKRALVDGLNRESRAFGACREALYRSGARFLADAQQSGAARGDATIDDVMRFVIGITLIEFASDAQRERVLAMALDGLRTRPTRYATEVVVHRSAGALVGVV